MGSIYEFGDDIPVDKYEFIEMFPYGLRCSCGSNTIFYDMENWKRHIETKLHKEWMKAKYDSLTTTSDGDLLSLKDELIKYINLYDRALVEIAYLKNEIQKISHLK